MAIDFSTMLDEQSDAVLDPRDIFYSLARQRSFSFLRDVQADVLRNWFEVRNNRDNVIKLNVGSGKTLVGLLILKSSLHEGAGPALYVTPNNHLNSQVIREAQLLGIPTTDEPTSASYGAGESICVVNVYKVFNGLSVFGVNQCELDIGTVVIDDVHACVSSISSQFRIQIGKDDAMFEQLLGIFAEDLIDQSRPRYLEIKSRDPRAILEVPFWAWRLKHPRVIDLISEHRNSDDFRFKYPLIKDVFPQCRCVIGGQRIEIEPYFPPTDMVTSFKAAKRRIYMSATLSDDTMMITHLGATRESLGRPIIPTGSQSIGERMILMPQELNPELTIREIGDLLLEFKKRENIVVIVPSETLSRDWLEFADQISNRDNISEQIDTLRNETGRLIVLINRYDGVDLPGSTCRILVLVGLPRVSSYCDLIDSIVLTNTPIGLRSQIERIEQGMGRAVRSIDDYCVVLLVGPDITQKIRSIQGRNMLTPSTREQLDLSRKISSRLHEASISDIRDVIHQCVDRDSGWIQVSKKSQVSLPMSDKLHFDPNRVALYLAFKAARIDQYGDAINLVDRAINGANDGQIRAWLLYWKALFQDLIDPQSAQNTLIAAHKTQPTVGLLKPLTVLTYRQISPTRKQANALVENHSKRFVDPVNTQLFARELCDFLRFPQGDSNSFEQAVEDLAWFLGIESQRPEKEFKQGPDNLWGLIGSKYLVIECKSGTTSGNDIAKKDVAQLGQSVEWFKERYLSSECIPLLFHPSSKLDRAASRVEGMRVVDQKRLENLRRNIKSFAKHISDHAISKDVQMTSVRLNEFKLNSTAFIDEFSVYARHRA